jgi:hypothetical protein
MVSGNEERVTSRRLHYAAPMVLDASSRGHTDHVSLTQTIHLKETRALSLEPSPSPLPSVRLGSLFINNADRFSSWPQVLPFCRRRTFFEKRAIKCHRSVFTSQSSWQQGIAHDVSFTSQNIAQGSFQRTCNSKNPLSSRSSLEAARRIPAIPNQI